MDRREALAVIQKATIDTTVGAAGLLSPSQSAAFIQTIKDKSDFGKAIRVERRRSATGELNKLTSGSRLLRAKAENADDGYRAQVSFPTVDYEAKKMWLPWEVTEDLYHENIEEQALEAKILDEMSQQFALDWDDLDVNGDEASANAFLQINDGLLTLLADTVGHPGVHRVDGSTINGGAISKDHFFAARYAMPDKYVSRGSLRWLASGSRIVSWTESLTDRATAAGDAALFMEGRGPLGIEWLEVPAMPDDRIVLADPKNLVRVVTWDVRRRKVTGETDWELATRDKRGYLFFVKPDFVILEDDAVVDVHTLDPVS